MHDGAKKAAASLLLLDREARARHEDTGCRDLALGHPFLCGVVQGYLVRGPLAWHPVTLERDARGARGFTLVPAEDDPPTVNLALLRLVFSKRGHAFTEALASSLAEAAEDPARSVEAVLETLAQVGLNAQRSAAALCRCGPATTASAWTGDRLELEECAVLGLFPQSAATCCKTTTPCSTPSGRPRGGPRRRPRVRRAAAPRGDARRGGARRRAAVAGGWALGPVLVRRPEPARGAHPRGHGALAGGRRSAGTGKNPGGDREPRGRRGGPGERVAVVCEARGPRRGRTARAGGGAADALALVHDVHDDRKALYAQLAARLE